MARSRIVLASFVAFSVVVLLCGGVDGRTITNAELNFTLVVPPRLQPISRPPGADFIAAFATSDPAKGVPDARVAIERLHGVIGREHLDPKKTPIPGLLGATVRQQKWKSFDIDVIEGQLETAGTRFASRGAQVPLQPEAIQLIVAVPVGKEAQADALLAELLAGLDGQSNWLTDGEREEKLGEALGQATVWFVAIGGLGLYFLYDMRRRTGQKISSATGGGDNPQPASGSQRA